MLDKEQNVQKVENSTVNQAMGDIHIHNGMSYSELINVCETTVRAEAERLTNDAKREFIQVLEDFMKRFYVRLEALENKENVQKLNKPSVQFCIHKAIMETAGTENPSNREELMDLLIKRLNVEEESTERVVIEDAIEKAAKLSKPLKTLLVALLFRTVIHPGPFLMDSIFDGYGNLFKELNNLTGLDIAFGRQMQCIYPMSGLMSGYAYEDILLRNYDLLFRHLGTYGEFRIFAESYPCILDGVRIANFDGMRIISFDGTKNPELTDDSEFFFVVPSSEFLKKLLASQGRSDMVQALDELLMTLPPFSHEEVRNYLHNINEGWDCLFATFRRREIAPLLLSPVGNYLAMGYSKKFGQQPDDFLAELYKHEQGW